jgi:hypothetical protein
MAEQRIQGAYAWRTFLAQGSRIVCGSDVPVEAPNPFFGIHAAQEMSLEEAFRCFTLHAAYAGHQEKTLGSLGSAAARSGSKSEPPTRNGLT